MERAEQLIEKLRLQIRGGEPKELVLATLRLLYAEIRDAGPPSGRSLQTGSVAVILPETDAFAAAPPVALPAGPEHRVVQSLEVDEKELEAELRAIREAAEFRNAAALHHRDPVRTESVAGAGADSFTPVDRTGAAMKAAASGEAASLNDRLAAREREVSDRLAEEPVTDLRKAVSLNDRFRFVNELFKGDAGLFEEAMRVLNGSPGLEQATAWIESECFGKLGWEREDGLCAQFVGLVRRRFL